LYFCSHHFAINLYQTNYHFQNIAKPFNKGNANDEKADMALQLYEIQLVKVLLLGWHISSGACQ
jgi:hypothetical protein